MVKKVKMLGHRSNLSILLLASFLVAFPLIAGEPENLKWCSNFKMDGGGLKSALYGKLLEAF